MLANFFSSWRFIFLHACSLLVNQQLGRDLQVLEWQSPSVFMQYHSRTFLLDYTKLILG